MSPDNEALEILGQAYQKGVLLLIITHNKYMAQIETKFYLVAEKIKNNASHIATAGRSCC